MTYLHDYEQMCRELSPTEQMEENALAFKEWRSAQRNEHQAYQRWLTICGVRLETVVEYDTLAEVIQLPVQWVNQNNVIRSEI